MLIFKKSIDIQAHLKKNGTPQVGFVPTMGALHEGHISLIKKAKTENELTVASIFVNPTQFNDAGDLEKYPRTVSDDIQQLIEAGTDILFLPDVEEIYPNGMGKKHGYDFGNLATVLEGKHRPGHFDGVAQVVEILLTIIQPGRLYLGQKDYQQFLIISQLVKMLKLPIQVIRCPIVREPDGLAMSSRNVRLDTASRSAATELSKTLFQISEKPGQNLLEIINQARESLGTNPAIKLEYLEAADAQTLAPITNTDNYRKTVVCLAAQIGGVRLIDNILI